MFPCHHLKWTCFCETQRAGCSAHVKTTTTNIRGSSGNKYCFQIQVGITLAFKMSNPLLLDVISITHRDYAGLKLHIAAECNAQDQPPARLRKPRSRLASRDVQFKANREQIYITLVCTLFPRATHDECIQPPEAHEINVIKSCKCIPLTESTESVRIVTVN